MPLVVIHSYFSRFTDSYKFGSTDILTACICMRIKKGEERMSTEALVDAILKQDVEDAKKAAEDCIAAGVDPSVALDEAAKAMTKIGDLFDRGKLFLPHVVISADAMKSASAILAPEVPVEKRVRAGKVVIGTVEGDVHDVGKGIVAILLDSAGFEVVDLGRDVLITKFVGTAKTEKPDIVGCSALMTTTRVGQRDVVEGLRAAGIRDKVIVMVGGGATTGVWAEEIGADAWGEDGPDAVRKAKGFIS